MTSWIVRRFVITHRYYAVYCINDYRKQIYALIKMSRHNVQCITIPIIVNHKT